MRDGGVFVMLRGFQICTLFVAVMAVASCGTGTNSGGTKAAVPPPSIQVDEVPQGVRIKWPAVKNALYYTVFWGSTPTEYRSFANSPNCSAIISGLNKGEMHCFAVTSWNERGESDYSKEAIYVYDEEPARWPEHLAKGKELMANGLYPEAHAYISAAIRMEPGRADAYKSRALLYEKMEEPTLAKKDHVRAEKLSNRKTASLDLNKQ